MRHGFSQLLVSSLVLLLSGCGSDQTPPTGPGLLTGPPDLTAVVFQSTRRSGATPIGYVTQYELWIGPVGSAAPDAGLVIGERTPVFQRSGEALIPTGGATIQVGDRVEVWRQPGAAYGTVQAPPGAPAYNAFQVVVSRP